MCGHFTSLEDSCVALFSEVPEMLVLVAKSFCTRDEGKLCEYTTRWCTVKDQSLGWMLNLLIFIVR